MGKGQPACLRNGIGHKNQMERIENRPASAAEAGRFIAYFRFWVYPRDLTFAGSRRTPALAAGVEGVEVLLVQAVGGDAEGFAVAYRV